MDIMGNDFVLVRGRDPIVLLLSRFPEFFARLEFEVEDDEPYLAYGAFADYLRQRKTDGILWKRAYAFFDDIATNEPSLHDLLSVALFEPLYDDAECVVGMKTNLGPTARTLFEEIAHYWESDRGKPHVRD